ncbi:MAG: YdcF family protein [Verrucomicrobiota bacterium]
MLSKTLGILLEPLFLPYLCLGLALLAKWRRRMLLMRILIATAIGLPVLYGFLPVSSLPLQCLENRIPPGDISDREIDGIIVLGGFTSDAAVAESRQTYGLIHSAERFTGALELSRKFPDTPVLFSGFSGRLLHEGWSEGDHIRDLVDRIGGMGPILYEEESRNTYENAVNSRELLENSPGANWILVTSACHMPRAIGCFQAAGWTGVIPYPVDYQTPKRGSLRLWSLVGIHHLRSAAHEYAGLMVYSLTGRSEALWPSSGNVGD